MTLREQAESIWWAGVQAVDAERLVRQAVSINERALTIAGEEFPVASLNRLIVVGGGKAGAGMVLGLERVLAGSSLAQRTKGWVNVPADCVKATRLITLHPGRPAEINEPTEAGVAGTREILNLAQSCGPADLCVVLLSGGGSALLPAPRGVSLSTKLEITRVLARSGATIQELNTVRSCLSDVKGGGLLRHIAGAPVRVLTISDVIGDPIDIIASGPAAPITPNPTRAREILLQAAGDRHRVPEEVWRALDQLEQHPLPVPNPQQVRHHLLGNNRVAVEAAARKAEDLGCRVEILGIAEAGIASEIGRQFAAEIKARRDALRGTSQRICLISGGEPTVKLASTTRPRRGGRNQELVLAAWEDLDGTPAGYWVLLSGGTDGEDGPTDAAGAVLDAAVVGQIRKQNLNVADYLSINNSYPFFEQTGGLLKTGPTHTNVMDLRVAIVAGNG